MKNKDLGVYTPFHYLYNKVSGDVDPNSLLLEAQKQAAKAFAGYWINDYREASIPSIMFNSSADEASAYFKSAFWLSVAARVLKVKSLAAEAQRYITNGNARLYTFSSDNSSSISGIYRSAVNSILKYGNAGNQSIRAILAALGHQSKAETIQVEKNIQDDRSVIKETISRSSEEIKGYATGKKPQHVSEFDWFIKKYGLYAGIAGSLALAALYISRPAIEAYSIKKRLELEDKKEEKNKLKSNPQRKKRK